MDNGRTDGRTDALLQLHVPNAPRHLTMYREEGAGVNLK
jgi:hypothetical protein